MKDEWWCLEVLRWFYDPPGLVLWGLAFGQDSLAGGDMGWGGLFLIDMRMPTRLKMNPYCYYFPCPFLVHTFYE